MNTQKDTLTEEQKADLRKEIDGLEHSQNVYTLLLDNARKSQQVF